MKKLILAFTVFIALSGAVFANLIQFSSSGGGGGGVTFVNSADLGNNGGSGNYTVAYTAGSGTNTILYLGVIGGTCDNVANASYNGVAMTLLHKLTPASMRPLYIFYLASPASGSNNFLIGNTGLCGDNYILAGAVEYSGTTAIDVDGTNQQTIGSQPFTDSVTPSVANTWALWFVSISKTAGTTCTAGTGAVKRSQDATYAAWCWLDSNATVASGSPYSMTVTIGTGLTGSPNAESGIFTTAP